MHNLQVEQLDFCHQHDVFENTDKKTAPTISSSQCVMPSNELADSMRRNRIMVIGSSVTTVQRVSRYCLDLDAEVFPYYGSPTYEEVSLFAPHIFVLCLPVPDDFRQQISQPYILWSEQPIDVGVPFVCTRTELKTCLHELFHD